ncbi:MAG TPA: (Fe-S)-binding protein, partial [Acidimicrobiales bacterium]|nr:(Fe-S)-binding protein [Acidimicrobiales bacterium]
MRAVQQQGAPLTAEIVRSWETCVQCRGCETACPSGVPFGRLMERTRETLAAEHRMTPRWLRLALAPLAHPRLVRAGTAAAAVAQRVGALPARLGLPERLPLRLGPHRSSGEEVWLFTGCVMDAWQREVHEATQAVVEATGAGVRPTGDAAPCCGALHVHAGLADETRRLARRMMHALAGDAPVLVDSAGCGAAMKGYGGLLGTPEAEAFSARVYDVSEWLAARMERLPAAEPLDRRVAVQDPCHLRHVQRAHQHTRTVLRPYVRELVELDDEGLCCGAGGVYSALERELAGRIRARKVAAIDRVAPDVVASANPGCSMHLAAAGVPTAHPMTLIAEALRR